MDDLRFKSWSASRLDDYTTCPFMAMHKHLLKTCPMCFKGKLKGYPQQICDTCRKKRVIPPPMKRGGVIGESLEKFVNGQGRVLTKEVANETARDLAYNLRKKFKAGAVKVEMMLNFDRNFKSLPSGWSPAIWLIVKLDVWETNGKFGHVLDWKTGGVDKNTKEIKAADKYGDQLLAYQVAGLCAFPEVDMVSSALCFVDAKGDSEVVGEPLARKDLKKAKDRLVRLSLPIMTDTTFAPLPSYKCGWCDFAKKRGGPCKHGDK